jgi:hypothetical protein
MIDRPNAAELLRAMAKTLTDEVLPETSGATRHSVRVVANLCLVLEREFDLGSESSKETREALVQLLGKDAPLPELVAEFDRVLRNADEDLESAARDILKQDVKRRLAIGRPGYDS